MNSTLKLIVLKGAETLGNEVNSHLQNLRNDPSSFIIRINEIRFNNGEGKIQIMDSVRDADVFILADPGNHSITYEMHGYTNHMSPDEHQQDIKRVISALKGHPRSISVVEPLFYSSRQHKRKGKESLDAALALKELESLGVRSVITTDVHDPNIQNATPCSAFENFFPTHTVLRELISMEINSIPKKEDLIVIAPDSGAIDRARYYADVIKCDIGFFHKRRDLTKIVDGKNPILSHEYLGPSLEGKSIIVVDDMISSGESMLDVAKEAKKRGAFNIFFVATFSLFTSGTSAFEAAFKEGLFNKIYTTNLSYISPGILKLPWLNAVNCSAFLAEIVNTIHNKDSVSHLLNGKRDMNDFLSKYYK